MKNIKLFGLVISLLFSVLVACENGGVSLGISSQKNLDTIGISKGTLMPTFSADITDYTASVDYTDTTFDLSFAPSSSKAKCYVNGQEMTTNSISIPLEVGENTVTVSVKAQDGVVKTYTLKITRAEAATVPDLQSLALSAGTLSPSYSSNTLSYTASAPYSTSSVNVTAVTVGAGLTMTINGQSATSGVPKAVSLAVGVNSIPVVVTAANGTTKTFSVSFTRNAANTSTTLSGLSLSSGALSPTFSSGTTTYTVSISNIPASYTVTATASNALSSLQFRVNGGAYSSLTSAVASGAINPSGVSNTLQVLVTAESGATQTYTLNITYDICGAGYYSDTINSCAQVGLGYYSPAADNARYSCSNKPANSRYTSPTASSSSCPWSCDDGYITTNGTSCSSLPNARTLACNDNEVAVGLYGKDGAIIDRLGVRCATIDGAGNLGTPRNGPDYGGNGGGWFNNTGTYDCPAGYAVYKVSGGLATYSGAPRTGTVSFSCKSVTNPSGGTVDRPNKTPPYFGSQTDRGPYSFECGVSPNLFGTFLNGIIIDNAAGAAYTGDVLGVTCR